MAEELEPLSGSIGAKAFQLEALRSFPEIARAAANDLRIARETRKKKPGPSRWALVNDQEAVLLDHVRDTTGAFHEGEVLALLQAAFYAFAPKAMKSKRYGDDPQTLLKRRSRLGHSPIRLVWVPELYGGLLRQTNP
jgi:hypothetical protein